MITMQVEMTVNGRRVVAEVEPRTLLVSFLRDDLRLTGTHVGCDTSQCGACTVDIDGEIVKSCTVLAVQAQGRSVATIEGSERQSRLDVVQAAFKDCHGLQCGFCTPGLVIAARALLHENPDPTAEDIRHALHGNICRCTGYHNIVKAVLQAAETLRKQPELSA